MANAAFPRPGMHGPQAVEARAVNPLATQRVSPLLHASSGEIRDRLFKFGMMACALAILAVLVLIVYELVSRSGLSWHAFGLKFFAFRRELRLHLLDHRIDLRGHVLTYA